VNALQPKTVNFGLDSLAAETDILLKPKFRKSFKTGVLGSLLLFLDFK
jgi:hypothetical protein